VYEPEHELGESEEDLSGLLRLVLHGRRVLIVGDDVAGADQIPYLIPPAGCALLLTSRSAFYLPALHNLHLGSLQTPEASALARKICERLSEKQAERLAQLCGGLPLALEFAASCLQVDGLPPELYLAQLAQANSRLRKLHDSANPNRSVEASLQLSYGPCTPEEQRALSELGVFWGEFGSDAALEVLGDEAAETLGSLHRRGLIASRPENNRFHMHDLVRLFVAERQAPSEEAHRRHADYYMNLVKQAERTYLEQTLTPLSSPLTPDDIENLLKAARYWLQREAGNDVLWLLASVHDLLFAEGYWPHLLQFVETVLNSALRIADPARRAEMLAEA
jgi:hypothetical protein